MPMLSARLSGVGKLSKEDAVKYGFVSAGGGRWYSQTLRGLPVGARVFVNIPGAELIPKGQFLSGAALSDLPQDRQIVLHCKVGGRSAEVLAIVKSAGFADAIHVGGGVVAWVNQIEPDKPNY